MRFRSFALFIVMAFALLVPRSAGADERARFAGTFKFAGDAAEEAARRDALDKTVARLFFAIRGIARSRLANGTKIDPWATFAFRDGQVRSRVPSGAEAVSPEQGTVVDYVSDGERSRLSQKLVGGKLTQVFAADEGQRTNEWTLSADGATLVLKVTISSAKLSVPCVYTLTYKRAP